MHFTRMRLQGFKSFVDPTELVIAPGLTGVVGPNGCGKSNLLEALRWVMGETSAKSMRGDGMEDVIFAGASTRPARAWAEVALSIDNAAYDAPAEFNKTDRFDITRRIQRDAGSAYKVDGKDARARDVRMLFADAATGAHSPALVRQGRISELINAKPKARRAILEDAAGIGGLYQRRHEAELKLRAAEENLTRVADVLEALEQQLASLARQARQAARYREYAEALRRAEGLLLWQRWREAEAERQSAEARLTGAAQAAARAQVDASERARAAQTAEEALPPLREEDAVAAAILQRHIVEREQLDERARQARADLARLEARGRQLQADMEREEALAGDADGSVAALEAEAEELTAAQEGHDDALGAALDAAQAAAKRVEAEEEALDRLTGDAARLAARHQAARRRMDEAEGEVRRTAADLEKAEGEARTLAAAIGEGETALAAAAAAMDTARGHAAQAERALGAAEAERAEAQQGESETRAAAAAAAGEASALRAEAEALRKLLARDAGEAGQLLDRVSVSPGYEAALGAALGDDLRAPEAEAGSGWRPLSDYDADAPAWGEGAAPLAAQVQAPAALSRRLARIAVVADVAVGDRLQPGLAPGERLVTREGDLWRWDGWRVAAGDASSTAALRLQQRNRLAALETALAEAEAKSDAARAAHAQAKARLAQAQQADARSREARRRADADRAEAEKRHGRAEGDLELRRARHAAVAESLHARADAAQAARDAAAEAAREAEALEDLDAARAAAEAAKTTVGEARGALLHARSEADGLRRVGESRAKRLAEIAQERAGWLRRKETAGTRIDELRTRIDETEEARKAAAETPGELELRRQALVAQIAQSEKRCQTAADALAAAEAAERQGRQAARDAETAAAEAREARARAQALGESAAERVAEAARRIAEEAEATPETLLERLDVDPETAPDASRTELDIVDLRRKRDALGAVNLRAEEDAAEVQEEKDQLAAEKIDLEAAIAKLRHGVASLNSEGRKRLLAAFDEVNANFAALFTRLFGGGQASLQLVESEDPLDAGLEILCMPPGKKLSTLSLLSGGEQTLTALALIFGVFLANPAPICVLDEVDAPLDDANVTRFCDLLDEMRRRADTRFLIITHHAVTMARMDRLFGVTMAEQGVSQLVSVDLERAEALVEG